MDWYTFLTITHIIGTSLGVGGATVSDFLFFKSIKDGKIDKKEFDFLKTVSSVVWLGFIVLVFSGFGFLVLYRLDLADPRLIYDPKLWAKLSVVLVVLFNGLAMHWKVFPLLESRLNKPLITPEFIKKAPVVFTTGAISIISWYSTLILGAWRNLELSYIAILGIYVSVVLVGVFCANMIGKYFIKYLK